MASDTATEGDGTRHLIVMRLGILVMLAADGWMIYRNFDDRGGHLIDMVNLAVHEAGHEVFRPFGDLWTAMGGSILQCLVPVLFLLGFWRRRQPYVATCMLWWLATNLWGVAVYMADAPDRLLPLTTPDESGHDFYYIFSMLDVLRISAVIARNVDRLGLFAYITFLALGLRYALRKGDTAGALAAAAVLLMAGAPPLLAQDPGREPPAHALPTRPAIPAGVVGWTFCRNGNAESWIRADQVRSALLDELLAHEAVHREQAAQFPSCEAWIQTLTSARRVIEAELPAYCAQLKVAVQHGARLDSLQVEYALRIATESGALENRLDIRRRLIAECQPPPS